MKQLLKKIKQISMLLLVISLIGCEKNDDDNYPKVVAGFTYTINADTGTVTFINTSVNTKNYFWDFGDETSSTEIDPIKTYPETDSYIVSLKATDVSGASNTFIDTIGILIKEAMSLPITFDNPAVKYDATVFNGAAFEIVDNPDVSGTNNKETQVGAITNSGATYEGVNFSLGTPIDFTSNKTITMNFWADAAVAVLMKLEEGTAANIEVTASHGGTGWELISFEFNSSDKYSGLTLFVDGPGTKAGTFYIDDIMQVKSAPVITLNGDDPMSIEIGSTFTDPGATAVDGYGVDISSSIITAGDTVDENIVGTYTITYNVSDEDGNAATEVTRTVNVTADAVKPVITLIGDATMNIMVGDAFTDPGATATDNVDGDITDSIVVAGDVVDVNTAGTYTITYNVSDAAGNAADEVTRTVTVEAPASVDGDYIYTTSGVVTIPSTISDWGSGTAIVSDHSGDGTYNPCIQLTSGTGWGDVSALAFTEIEAGKILEYTTLEFKIKTTDYTTIKVKMPGATTEEPQFTIANGTELTDGWVQMSIELSEFGTIPTTIPEFAILEFGAGTILITDVLLSGEGGGVTPPPSGDCTPPAGDFISNGGFESGDASCWLFFDNGGTTSVTNTENNGGTYSAKITTAPLKNPGIKNERFGAGTIASGQVLVVNLDSKVESLVDGAVVNVLAFSESSIEGVGAVLHNLGSINVAPGSWNSNTMEFTTAADVSGGVSLLIEVVCGGADTCAGTVYIDNVSVTLK